MRALIACILFGYSVVQFVVSCPAGIDALEASAYESQQCLTSSVVVD